MPADLRLTDWEINRLLAIARRHPVPHRRLAWLVAQRERERAAKIVQMNACACPSGEHHERGHDLIAEAILFEDTFGD